MPIRVTVDEMLAPKFCAALGCSPAEPLDDDFDATDLQGGDED